MPTHHLLAATAAFAPLLFAQQPTVELPTLLTLGAEPDGAPTVTVARDGTLHDAERAVATTIVAVDRFARAGDLVRVLDQLRAGGVTCVHFAAKLPDGARGTIALTLGAAAEATLQLRLHHERPGVPADSLTLMLRRMRRGLSSDAQIDVDVPAAMFCSQLLPVIAAIADSRAGWPVLRARAGGAGDGAPAIDLGPSPFLWIAPHAVPREKAQVAPSTVGDRGAAPAPRFEERSGGRYGGRADGKAKEDPVEATAAEQAKPWLLRQQRSDGGFTEGHGAGEPTATAMFALSMLADGHALDAGPRSEQLRRAIGWLLANQDVEGGLAGDDRLGHALATWAICEASGLSTRGPLLRGAAEDAVSWLLARRNEDGGFPRIAGGPSDAVMTAMACIVLASARFFEVPTQESAESVVAWFEKVVEASGTHRATIDSPALPVDQRACAAALFARMLCGQDPKQDARLVHFGQVLAEGDHQGDPWACWLTTNALYQIGGKSWATWNRSLRRVVEAQETAGELQNSWPPTGDCSRLHSTLLRVLTLQVYYRYSRIMR